MSAAEAPRELTADEGCALFDKTAQRLLGMSGEEFLAAYDRGDFNDGRDHCAVTQLEMLIPFVREVKSMNRDEESVIRHRESDDLATVSSGRNTYNNLEAIGTRHAEPNREILTGGAAIAGNRRYLAPMGKTTASNIAAALREHLSDRITYLPDRKLHALLYLAQGICFAANDEPLFTDPIVTDSWAVHVEGVNEAPSDATLDDLQLSVIATTTSRYGGLSAMDLEALIRGQEPWDVTEPDHAIDPELIRSQFRTQDEIPEGTLLGWTRSERAAMRRPDRDSEPTGPGTPYDPAEVAAFVAEYEART